MLDDNLTPDTLSFNEFPIYWEFPINLNGESVKCKSLIDRLLIDHKNKRVTIVDLKTTSVLGSLDKTIEERNYYRQLAFYRLAVQSLPEITNDYQIDCYIVAVNTQDPFECKVYKLSESTYIEKLLEISSLLSKISWHWFSNQWEYSRNYYDGDGTENILYEHSNSSIK
jgi:CRISPR/Cas system-associated exonuclease Cas4 (RecB family)